MTKKVNTRAPWDAGPLALLESKFLQGVDATSFATRRFIFCSIVSADVGFICLEIGRGCDSFEASCAIDAWAWCLSLMFLNFHWQGLSVW